MEITFKRGRYNTAKLKKLSDDYEMYFELWKHIKSELKEYSYPIFISFDLHEDGSCSMFLEFRYRKTSSIENAVFKFKTEQVNKIKTIIRNKKLKTIK